MERDMKPYLMFIKGFHPLMSVMTAGTQHPPIDLAKGLVEEMVENMALIQ